MWYIIWFLVVAVLMWFGVGYLGKGGSLCKCCVLAAIFLAFAPGIGVMYATDTIPMKVCIGPLGLAIGIFAGVYARKNHMQSKSS